MGTDPVENADVTPSEVYARDMAQVDAADLIVAYVGERSLGVGAEIERAVHTGADVVLLYEDGRYVSRLIRGCPSVKMSILFEDADDALRRLAEWLSQWTAGRDR